MGELFCRLCGVVVGVGEWLQNTYSRENIAGAKRKKTLEARESGYAILYDKDPPFFIMFAIFAK